RRGDVGRAGGGHRVEDRVGERAELLVLRDEVRLAGELDDGRLAVRLGRGDETFRRGAVGALGVALRTLQAEDLNGLLQVAVRLLKGLLGVDHAGAELLTQRLDVGDADVCHVWLSLAVGGDYSAAGASAAFSSAGASSAGFSSAAGWAGASSAAGSAGASAGVSVPPEASSSCSHSASGSSTLPSPGWCFCC